MAGVVFFFIGPFFYLMAFLSRNFTGEFPLANILYLTLIFLYYSGLTYFLVFFFKNKKWLVSLASWPATWPSTQQRSFGCFMSFQA